MKKVISCFLIAVMLLLLTSCGSGKNIEQDNSPITIFVGLGNGQVYYDKLVEAIRKNLGIDVEMIYQSAVDTTSAVRLEFKNNDMPADIVCTASRTNSEWAKNSCLDYMSYTNLLEDFTFQKINEYTNDDGTVYQIPFTTKLIGITYNKTLMEENNWEVPDTFQDMLDLKKKCEEEGILFAVSANVATGHGFNYLFHTMGAEWINTFEGTEWLNNFLDGTEDAARFKEKARYFDKWKKNGLFGSIHSEDWNAADEFCKRRALFLFDLTNSVYSYEGEMYDENGNPTGIMLNDEYASMPWISEDGTNNCYTYYDNLLVAMNKKLVEPDQHDRLEKVIKILEFMTTEEVTKIFTDSYKDGYVAVNDFKIDESRLYYEFRDAVETGYTMPWYYNYFDEDTIVNTGDVINKYLRNEGPTFDDIIDTLEENNTNRINKEDNILSVFENDLTYEETAKLNAVGAILSLQNEYDLRGIEKKVSVGMIAYVEKLGDHQPFSNVGTLSTRFYAGPLEDVFVETAISAKAQKVSGIEMKGSKIKEIASAGVRDGDVVYPYVMVSTEKIEDNGIYIVAVSNASLNEEYKTEFSDSGAIIVDGEETVTAPINTGIRQYLKEEENDMNFDGYFTYK